MRLIKLKEIWNMADPELVDKCGALTEKGAVKYWMSVSASADFNWQKVLQQKSRQHVKQVNNEQDPMYNVFRKNKMFFQNKKTHNDKYHWHKGFKKPTNKAGYNGNSRKLPTPKKKH